ncbi:MAG: polysaccharide biosynthesis/export family protein [bacterium]
MKKLILLNFIMTVALAVSGIETRAQQAEPREKSTPSQYIIGEEGQLLLPVNILGLVQKPGQYKVPYGTDLISLIAYAGGFTEDAKINEIKIVRSVQSNGSKRKRARVFKVNVKRYFDHGDKSQVPELQPEDTILVTGTAARTFNKIFSFFRTVLPAAQLVFIVIVSLDRR